MSSEYNFTVDIPEEVLSEILIATDIEFQNKIKLNITYENGTYRISEIDDRIVVNNKGLGLLEGHVYKDSLDIYSDEEI